MNQKICGEYDIIISASLRYCYSFQSRMFWVYGRGISEKMTDQDGLFQCVQRLQLHSAHVKPLYPASPLLFFSQLIQTAVKCSDGFLHRVVDCASLLLHLHLCCSWRYRCGSLGGLDPGETSNLSASIWTSAAKHGLSPSVLRLERHWGKHCCWFQTLTT